MRILYCNKYNYPFSGTEVYLFELMRLMQEHGHEAALFSMLDSRGTSTRYDHHFLPHIEFKDTSWKKFRNAGRAIYSWDARRRIRAMIKDFRPDVAHVRNIYHHLTPSILWELRKQRVPVVYHVNDFKLLCPSYNLVSRGEACEACSGGAFWHALPGNCYPGLGARATLMLEAYVHRGLGTYRKCVDLFLAPSKFVRDKFVEHGWDAKKFEVLPHFQDLPGGSSLAPPHGPILYFGRLSPEKGVLDLLRAMVDLPDQRLVIAGDGPDRKNLQDFAASLRLRNVQFVGQVNSTERDALITQSRFTVFPSHAYETFGKTILESYAQGRPVVASDLGSRRELVLHGETGLLYRTGSVKGLADAIRELLSHPEQTERMGWAGQAMLKVHYTPAAHYQKLTSFYARLLAPKPKTRSILVPTRKDPPWTQGRVQPRTANLPPDEVGQPAQRLRVAFIGGRGVASKYSGIETYYEEVGRRLVEMGHEVTVYCRTYFTPDLGRYNGMSLVRLPTIRSKHFETVLHTLLSTAHAVTQHFDLVHYHALGPALFSSIPRLLKSKTAVTVQGLDWQRKKWGKIAAAVLRLGEGASVMLPTGTMVVSKTLQQRYRDAHGADTYYVPNGGIVRDRTLPRKILDWQLTSGDYVLYLGRFSPEKGCHLLVQAFEQLHTGVKLVMAGASSYCDEYSRELRTHASDHILMLDWVSGETLDELLTNAMIFVLPSDLEGLSLALLDAMGAGLCVLTSDVPENREVVDGAGFTFQRGNPVDLADRLRFLIANPAVREAAGKAAKKRIREEYQWDKIAVDIERAYFQMMGWKVAGTASGVPKKTSARAEAAASESSPGIRNVS
jgi:glycosyltransferase involved in cell wall biosynthesis